MGHILYHIFKWLQNHNKNYIYIFISGTQDYSNIYSELVMNYTYLFFTPKNLNISNGLTNKATTNKP